MDLISIFKEGGFMMWPLLLLALAALAIIFERFITLNKLPSQAKAEKQLEDVEMILKEEGIEACAKKLAKGKGALNYIFARLLKRYDTLLIEKREYESRKTEGQKVDDPLTNYLSKESITNEFRDELLITVDEASRSYLTKFMPALNTVSNISPLMGLLGTIIGMIISFDALSSAGTSDPRIVAGGIKIALYTTATGLIIAIPAVIGYRFLGGKADAKKSELEIYGITFSNSLLGLLEKEN